MADREKVMKGLAVCIADFLSRYTCKSAKCPYACIEDQGMQHYECRKTLLKDALELLKEQQSAMLQGFLTDIPSSESILNSVYCHAISLEDASKIIAICACVCDLISPSGFISWLKERIAQDAILKGCVENN